MASLKQRVWEPSKRREKLPPYEPSSAPTTKLAGLPKIVRPPKQPSYPERRRQPDSRRSHHGVPTMLNETAEAWLRRTYPALVSTGDAVSGTIDFKASYNRDTNRFLILSHQVPDQTG